jgi:phosphatidylglycerophosphatase C
MATILVMHYLMKQCWDAIQLKVEKPCRVHSPLARAKADMDNFENTYVAAFDMDGTLTKGDSFWRFLVYASNPKTVIKAVLKNPVVVTKAIFFPSKGAHLAKEYLVESTIKNMTETELAKISVSFVLNKMLPTLNKNLLKIINFHKEHKHKLILVTASLDIYAKELAKQLGFDDVLATNLEVINGLITGKFSNKNNRGPEKAKSIKNWLQENNIYNPFLIAYGNSANDKEMLKLANIAFRVDKLSVDEMLKILKQFTHQLKLP